MHTTPQPPQLFGSLSRSAQPPLQMVSPVGHVHVAFTQASPAGQTSPHAPQLRASLIESTQTPLQLTCELVQAH